mgnify:CR=1 FL=1
MGAVLVICFLSQALQAMALAFTHLRIVLEPGGAAALAAALFGEDLPDTVIAVATGGNVDPATFATALVGAMLVAGTPALRQAIIPIWNAYSFFTLYANVAGDDGAGYDAHRRE